MSKLSSNILFTLGLVVIFGGVAAYLVHQSQTSNITLEALYNQLDPTTQWYKKYQKESGIDGLDSFSYTQEGNKITIHAGNYCIDTTVDELLTEDNRANLKKIGITIAFDKKTGHLRLKYQGENIKEYVS